MGTVCYPVVDNFGLMMVSDVNRESDFIASGSSSSCIGGGTCITVSAAGGGRVTFAAPTKLYMRSIGGGAGSKKVYPTQTLIVHAKDGEVNGLSWDDGCSLCTGDSECE